MQGKIIKGIAGFYYVNVVESGLYECKAKGSFRKNGIKPLVGDEVELEVLDEEEKIGNVTKILPRKNELIRPAVANIDQALVVFAVTEPKPHYNLLDRFLVMMERQEIPVIICFNKKDIADEPEIESLEKTYEACGYRVIFASAREGENILEIKEALKGKTTTVAGPSGVGKSSLINALTNQEVSIVADVAGTTTDPVYKPMEIHPLGACVLIDTAGFDDTSELGTRRVEKTKLAAEKTDIAVIVLSAEEAVTCADEQGQIQDELKWYRFFREKHTPVLFVINKADQDEENAARLAEMIYEEAKEDAVIISAKKHTGIEEFKTTLIRLMPENFGAEYITGNLVEEDDLVLLVMPQDIQAPKGRLILPQVQTIRELLDKKCLVMSVTTDKFLTVLPLLARAPKLIITDSQVFGYVYENKPKESMLTSFSVLFAAYKGDLPYYVQGAKAIDSLTLDSKVLIAECCTHAPLKEDIGRVKIPRMLKKCAGETLTVDIVSGTDFPQDLSGYDLIIQCGACMFNRKYVLSRIDRAKKQQVPMTNYGVTIAHLTGILDNISMP